MKHTVCISIMGTMGSGKTTASHLLATHLRYRLIEENFGENAFLPRFYNDMKRWAFHSQTFFLMEKINQLFETKKILIRSSVVQDTPIVQDVFSYAKAQHVLGHVDDAEWRLYQKIYRSFEPYIPKPDLIVYLETSLHAIEARIKKRGRGYEKEIPDSYLELLDMLNKKWLDENKNIPFEVVNTDGLNIVRSQKDKKQFVSTVKSLMRKHGI